MSTQPTPVVTAPPTGLLAEAISEESKISKYLLKHEKLIIAALVLGVSIHFYSKVVDWAYNHDKLKDSEAHEAAAAQIAVAAATASANAEKEAQYEELKKQLDETKAELNAQIAKTDSDLKKQQLADMQLPLTGLQSRWADLLGQEFGPQQGLSVNYTGSATDPNDPNAMLYVRGLGAKDTVAMLEEVPALKADLKAETTIVANDATQIASITDLNTGLHKQIDQLNGVIVKNNGACEADKTLMRGEFRKSKLKWFFGGIAVGLGIDFLIHRGTTSPTAVGNVSIPAL